MEITSLPEEDETWNEWRKRCESRVNTDVVCAARDSWSVDVRNQKEKAEYTDMKQKETKDSSLWGTEFELLSGAVS